MLTRSSLDKLAAGAGLAVVGVTALPAVYAEDAARLARWQEAGRAGAMSYMNRSPELLTTPAKLEPEAVSLISFAAFYDRGPHPEARPEGFGRVARYAWGRDYHRVLRKALKAFVAATEQCLGRTVKARVFTDAVPLLERAVAREAGAGFIGKNTMLIQPAGKGSFFFLAEVLLDVAVDGCSEVPTYTGCRTCTRCLTSCPTNAFAAPFQLDARRCISYLTIEKRGALSPWERAAIGEWVFGCDVCQEVCPFNHHSRKEAPEAQLIALRASHGCGALLALSDVLSIRDEAAFEQRFGGTALMRTTRAGLLRNAAVVAANTGSFSAMKSLEEAALTDSHAIVRSHALWALVSLARLSGQYAACKIGRIIDQALRDPDPLVVEEAKSL